VPERDEVHYFGEPVHNHEDYRLAVDAWKPLDEVHGDIHADRCWHNERLKKALQMKVIGLVPLAHGASMDIFLYCGPHEVEVRAKAVEGFLDALMPCLVCAGQNLDLARQCRQNVDVARHSDQVIYHMPFVVAGACEDLLLERVVLGSQSSPTGCC
jgi:hypothetical protein